MKIKGFCIVLILSLVISQKAMAWGATGHRAIATVAYEHLDKKVKANIKTLLGDDFIPYFSNWADEVRSIEGHQFAELRHYVNMPFGVKYQDSDKHQDGDIVTILNEMVSQLKDENSTKEEKADALKIIIHLMGDIHQPMHVGLEEDLGGNLIEVKWFGKPTNLHRLWDEGIIEHSQLSYTELAHFSQIEAKLKGEDVSDANFVECVDETRKITKQIYNKLGDKNFGYAYYREQMPIVLNQVNKAGIRLAYMLNKVLR